MPPVREVAPASAMRRRTLPARCPVRDTRRAARQTHKRIPYPENGSRVRQRLRVVPLERSWNQPRGGRFRQRLSLEARFYLLRAKFNDQAYQPYLAATAVF